MFFACFCCCFAYEFVFIAIIQKQLFACFCSTECHILGHQEGLHGFIHLPRKSGSIFQIDSLHHVCAQLTHSYLNQSKRIDYSIKPQEILYFILGSNFNFFFFETFHQCGVESNMMGLSHQTEAFGLTSGQIRIAAEQDAVSCQLGERSDCCDAVISNPCFPIFLLVGRVESSWFGSLLTWREEAMLELGLHRGRWSIWGELAVTEGFVFEFALSFTHVYQ